MNIDIIAVGQITDIVKKYMGRYGLFILVIVLQIILSNAKNKIVGLILPFLTFLVSLVLLFSMGFSGFEFKISSFLILAITVFAFNIPTIILMIIYTISKRLRRK